MKCILKMNFENTKIYRKIKVWNIFFMNIYLFSLRKKEVRGFFFRLVNI